MFFHKLSIFCKNFFMLGGISRLFWFRYYSDLYLLARWTWQKKPFLHLFFFLNILISRFWFRIMNLCFRRIETFINSISDFRKFNFIRICGRRVKKLLIFKPFPPILSHLPAFLLDLLKYFFYLYVFVCKFTQRPSDIITVVFKFFSLDRRVWNF